MSQMVARMDDLGMPAWIALMIVAFILFWPVGLAVLAFLLWSGRMGCSRFSDEDRGRWERRMARFHERWGCRGRGRGSSATFGPSGNRAFDEYRQETLKRLEEEADEFRSFLDRLRLAKDKAEFEDFMTERRNRPSSEPRPDNGGSVPTVG